MTVKTRVTRILGTASRLGLLEIKTLLVVLILAGAAWIFTGIATEVGEGETRSFDEKVLLAMRVISAGDGRGGRTRPSVQP